MLASFSHMIRETSSALSPASLVQKVQSATQTQQAPAQSTQKETDIASTTSLNTTDQEGANVDSLERKAEKERRKRDKRSAILYEVSAPSDMIVSDSNDLASPFVRPL